MIIYMQNGTIFNFEFQYYPVIFNDRGTFSHINKSANNVRANNILI